MSFAREMFVAPWGQQSEHSGLRGEQVVAEGGRVQNMLSGWLDEHRLSTQKYLVCEKGSILNQWGQGTKFDKWQCNTWEK